MSIFLVIEEDKVTEVKSSPHRGVRGIWVNADQVSVFIPKSVLMKCQDEEEDNYISQATATNYFLIIKKHDLNCTNFLTSSERAFITGCRGCEKNNKYEFSTKQKAMLWVMYNKYEGKIKELDGVDKIDKNDDIPF